MPYLVAAVVFVAVFCVLNLLLLLGVLGRLREHTTLLSKRTAEPGRPIIETGERPGAFSVSDSEGNPVTLDADGPTLVGFFSPDCKPCREHLPDFVAQAAGYPGGRDRVVAVVAGDQPAAGEFAAMLAPAARVVVEQPDGALATAFHVQAFPSWCVVDETGTVQQTGHANDPIPSVVAA